MIRTVACPSCGVAVPWEPQQRFRPFCSERCKLIDLGAWANEQYRVNTQEQESGNQQPES